MAESSNTPKIFSEHAKSIMTLRNDKIIEQLSETQKTKTNEMSTEPEPSKDKKDPKAKDEPTSLVPPQVLRAPFSSALESLMPFNKKGGKLDEML